MPVTTPRDDRDPSPERPRQAGRHFSAAAHASGARRWAMICTAMVLAVVVGMGAVSLAKLQVNLSTSALNLGADGAPEDGSMDILVMGSDTRGNGNERYGQMERGNGTGKTDVMMLVHIPEDRQNVVVTSFPRDLVVDIPQCTDPSTGQTYEPMQRAMLNSAAENGGPGCTVATIEHLTGIAIEHFMLADFKAVTELSRTVGGVEICVTQPVDDPKSGLKLPAGRSVVEGEQALSFLRSRHAFGDGGDESRIRSQQQFMSSLARKMTAEGTLTDVPRLYEIASAMTRNLHVDDGLGNVGTIVGIARMMAGVDLSNVVFLTVPTEVYEPDPNRLQLDQEPAQALFRALREDQPLDQAAPSPSSSPSDGPSASPSSGPSAQGRDALLFEPSTVPVEIRNASGRDQRGEEVVRLLQDAGYASAVQGPQQDATKGTQVHYAAGWYGAAQQLTRELKIPQSQIVWSPDLDHGVRIVVGQDFATGDTMSVGGAVPEGLSGQTAEQFTCQQ